MLSPSTTRGESPLAPSRTFLWLQRAFKDLRVPCEIVTAGDETLRIGEGLPKFRVILHSHRVLARGLDEFALAQGFVNGDFDIEGDMMSFFEVRHHLRQRTGLIPWLLFWGQLLFLAPTRVNRSAIRHHYEFGDDFFLSFIDKDYHLYSHGFFASDDEPLETASERKLATMYDWAQLKPGMRVLDIGAGWGGVTRYCGPRGVHVTSLTLAEDSREHIGGLLAEKGYPGEVRLEDFLQHEPAEPYDAIVILGVIEHIPYYRKFFRKAWDLLKPGARIYMDASADLERYGVSRFIRHYIYPGTHSYMCLQDVLREMLFHGFMPHQLEQDNHSYMLTMRHWAERFEANRELICRKWGEQVYRSFWLYLWSGAYAFGHNVLQAYHLVAERTTEPGPRPGLGRRLYSFARDAV